MCVLLVRVFAFRPNRFLPASTRFFRSFPSGPAASVRFPSSGLFSSAPFVRVSSSTGSVLLFHYRKITDFPLCGRHACPSRPACSLSVSVRSVLPFLSVPLRAVSPPRCPCIDFPRRRFFTSLPGNSPDSLPLRPPYSPLLSVLFSFRFFPLGLTVLSVLFPSCFPFPPPFGCSVLPFLFVLRLSFCLPRSVVRSFCFCLPRRLYCRPACPFSVRSFFRGKTRS